MSARLGLEALAGTLREAPVRRRSGRVVRLVGTLLEAELPGARVGEVCRIDEGGVAETVGFRETRALLMPFGAVDGMRFGARVETLGEMPSVPVGEALRGRVLDGFGEPMDGKGSIANLPRRALHAAPPDPLARAVIRTPMETGVRVLDGLLTFGRGQRVGLMAGSGVGKSTLMGMIARRSAATVNVIALIGERGREVREFLEDTLGEEGSVVLVADRADDRGRTGHRSTHDSFIAKRDQLEECSATSGDDDDVDFGIGIELRDSAGNLRGRTVPRDTGVDGSELDVGPAITSIDENVLFGVRVFRGDESDAPREFRQRNLSGFVERPLGLKCCAQFFDGDEEVAETLVSNRVGDEL